MESTRFNLVIGGKMVADLDRIRTEAGISRTELIRRAIALYKTAYDFRKAGLFVGVSRRQEMLDTVIVGID